MDGYPQLLGLGIALFIILTAGCQPIQAPAASVKPPCLAPDNNILLGIINAPTTRPELWPICRPRLMSS
ncbi:MAG: hypothetical protein R2867_38575 [Caldilineaceae bacterium]